MILLTVSRLFYLTFFITSIPALAQSNQPVKNGERVDANGIPTTHSTPAEHVQTELFNKQAREGISTPTSEASINKAGRGSATSQYQKKQKQYQDDLQKYQAAQEDFANRIAVYNKLTNH